MKNHYLVQPQRQQGQGNNVLYQAFNPYQNSSVISQNDLSELANKHGNFYNQYKNRNEYTKYQEEVNKFNNSDLGIKAKSIADKNERVKFLNDNNYPRKPTPIQRELTGQNLGRFTIEALSRLKDNQNEFQGIKLDGNLTSSGIPSRGLFTAGSRKGTQGRAVYLNPNRNDQDILGTIVHEGNHAIEHYNPYINRTLQDFLNKKIEKEESDLPANYLPNLYKGIQDIINLPDEFTQLYQLNDKFQKEVITKDKIYPKDLQGNLLGKTLLANKFEEIPAFALETMTRNNHPWVINKNTNDDSRKLLRRIMKEQQQQYRNLGLVDKTKPLNSNTGYKYNKNPVQYYESPVDRSKYKFVDDAFIERINALKNPNPVQQTTTTTSITPSQSFQNPITQAMTQNQSPYYGNQLTQLMNNQGDINQNLTSTMTPTTNYYNTQPYFSRNPKSGNRYLPSTNGKYSNLLLGNRYHPYARPEIGILRNKS